MEQSKQELRRKTGRPISFDREVALRAAMLVFWRHGFEGASLNALTAAMGITPPSVYAAFGDKRKLFREAVKLYLSGGVQSADGGYSAPMMMIKSAPSARDAAERLMRSAAVGFTGPATPAGCLLASSAISCSPEASDIRCELATIRQEIEAQLRRRIRVAIEAGELGARTDATALAAFVMTVIQGMSTLARDGAKRKKLLSVVDLAMKNWPSSPQ
jgi:AcrR family transcriptional regulator